MRTCTVSALSLLFVLGSGCFADPVPNITDDGETGDGDGDGDTGDGDGDTGDGDGDTGDGDGDGDTGDGDGDSGDGDGDGDGDPGENVVVDLFAEACGLTATWTTLIAADGPDPAPIPCDMMGAANSGWMVRYPELMLGDTTFEKVIGLVPGFEPLAQVRGSYNVDDVPDLTELEFRADVLLRCAPGDPDCVGRVAFAVAEGVQNGLYSEVEDRMLGSGMQPMSIAVSLDFLVTLSEPTIVLVAERSDAGMDPSPEILIVNPRLVLP